MPTLRRLFEFLALEKNLAGLLGMVIFVGIGEKMSNQFIPVFLVAAGGSILTPGIKGFLDNLLSAFYSASGGDLTDRLGTKRALIICDLISIVGYAVVVIWPTWLAMLGGSFLFSAWSAISMPATVGLIARSLPKGKRTMAMTVHSLVRRVPMAIGPMLGGMLIDMTNPIRGVQIGFAVAIVMALCALLLQHFLIAADPAQLQATQPAPASTADAKPASHRSFATLWSLMNGDLRNLLVSDILIRFCEQIPYAYIVLWCVDALYHPGGVITATEFGTLRAVEMTTAALIYVPVAYWADKGAKKPFVVLTFLFFTAFPLLLVHCHTLPWLMVAFVVRGLKEFGEPTRKALIMDLAPEDRKAAVFGFYYFLRDTVVALAGAFLWQIDSVSLGAWRLSGSQLNFYVAGTCGAIGTLWFAVWGRDLSPGPVKTV